MSTCSEHSRNMPPIHRVVCILFALVVASQGVYAQGIGYLSVSSNAPSGEIYADSVRLGEVREGPFAVAPGETHVRLVAPKVSTWSIEPVETDVRVVAGDTTHVALSLPYHYRVESVPYGASVYVDEPEGRRRVGETPVTLKVDEPLQHELLVDRPGYFVERIEPGSDLWNRYAFVLRQTARNGEQRQSAEVAWSPPKTWRSRWIEYASLGLAVAGAVATVHYKFKADRLYDEYEETGDPALRSRIERYDTRAGVALGAMQVGVGVFAIRLALK